MKLYLVTHRQLSPGARAAQCAHALREFTEHFPDANREWYANSNTLVLVDTTDEASLRSFLASAAATPDTAAAPFYEPDLGDALTAVAVYGPKAKALCRQFPLAYSQSL